MLQFDHERMEVYRRALGFVKSVGTLRRTLPSGRGSLGDQLDRAALSIALNIAEGAGEFARREKVRFYRMARRSATECAAIFDVIDTVELADKGCVTDGKAQLRVIVAMLITLSKRLEGEELPSAG